MTKEAVLTSREKIKNPGTSVEARRLKSWIDSGIADPDAVEDLKALAEGLDTQDIDYMLLAAQDAAEGEGLPQFEANVSEYLENRQDYRGS